MDVVGKRAREEGDRVGDVFEAPEASNRIRHDFFDRASLDLSPLIGAPLRLLSDAAHGALECRGSNRPW
jgi:hypothetical protein